MKLLDQNLSPRLVQSLAATYPGTSHVREVGLHAADDESVRVYAADQGFVIVSKDADFHQRSFVLGHPPKVVWIRRGNCSTAEIEALLLGTMPRCSPSSGPKKNRSRSVLMNQSPAGSFRS